MSNKQVCIFQYPKSLVKKYCSLCRSFPIWQFTSRHNYRLFFYDCALLNAKFNYPGTYVPLEPTTTMMVTLKAELQAAKPKVIDPFLRPQ